MQFHDGASVAISGPVRLSLFPAVTVAVARECGLGFWRKIDLVGVVNLRIHQRFLVVFSGKQHVERRNDEQREDCPDSHAADENETD